MITDIAGNLSREDLRGELDIMRDKFPFEVDGFLNGTPAKYLVDVEGYFPEYKKDYPNFLYYNCRFKGSFEDWLSSIKEKEPREYWRKYWEKAEIHYEGRLRFDNPWSLGWIFPHHNLALITNHVWRENFPDEEDLFGEFGYRVIKQETDSTIWCDKTKFELLAALRNPDYNLKAFDPRAQRIVNSLAFHFSKDVNNFTFGVYHPKKKEFTWVGDYHEILVESEESRSTHSTVKELVEIPLNKFQVVESLCKGLPLTRAVGLTSIVETNRGKMHIPMIDFERGDPIEVLDELDIPGMIVCSGNSHHFYGFELFDDSEWRNFMNKIKDYPEVDKYWPNLQLQQGFSMLRLTPMKTKLFQPCFLKWFKKAHYEEDTKLNQSKSILLRVA